MGGYAHDSIAPIDKPWISTSEWQIEYFSMHGAFDPSSIDRHLSFQVLVEGCFVPKSTKTIHVTKTHNVLVSLAVKNA